jgi:hypothetical protein
MDDIEQYGRVWQPIRTTQMDNQETMQRLGVLEQATSTPQPQVESDTIPAEFPLMLIAAAVLYLILKK